MSSAALWPQPNGQEVPVPALRGCLYSTSRPLWFLYFWRAFTDAQLDLPKAQMFSVPNLRVSVENAVRQVYLVLNGFLYNSDLFILLILPFSVHLAHTRSCQANNGTQKNLFYFKTFLKY